MFFLFTYRLELLCDAVKTLRLAWPVVVAASTLSGHACLVGAWAVGGSPAVRPLTAGPHPGGCAACGLRSGPPLLLHRHHQWLEGVVDALVLGRPKPSLIRLRALRSIRPAQPLLGKALWPSVACQRLYRRWSELVDDPRRRCWCIGNTA